MWRPERVQERAEAGDAVRLLTPSGRVLLALAKYRRLSQAELARRAGYDRKTVRAACGCLREAGLITGQIEITPAGDREIHRRLRAMREMCGDTL